MIWKRNNHRNNINGFIRCNNINNTVQRSLLENCRSIWSGDLYSFYEKKKMSTKTFKFYESTHKIKSLQVWGIKIPRYVFLASTCGKILFIVAAVEVFAAGNFKDKKWVSYEQMKQLKFHLKLIILKCV